MNNKPPIQASNLSLRNKDATLVERQGPEPLRQYLQAATSDNTRKAYRSAIRQFEKWGGRLPSDRDTVVRYLLARAESLNPRTLEGVRRTHGQPKRKAKALRLEHVAQMVNHLRQLPTTKKKLRDIALVLTGFFGAFRRSELVAIRYGDLVWEPEGLLIRLSSSKTDQQASGLVRALPFGAPDCCPATAMKNWIELGGINEGPVFRPINRWDKIQPKALNPSAINELLKTLGNACQFDFVPELSSHSFRRGLSTSAARERVDFELIKKQGGWKSDATVWEYIEEGQQLSNNATHILMEKMAVLIDTVRVKEI